MHGQGTYIGEFGDTFAGLWANNLRHGRGTQAYANGDVYDGHWRDGLQDGYSRYSGTMATSTSAPGGPTTCTAAGPSSG